MADKNLVIYSASHAYTGGASGHEGAYGIDENFSTYHGDEYSLSGGSWSGSASKTIISEHTFSRPLTVNSIKYRIYAQGYSGGPDGGRNVQYLMYVQYKVSGGEYQDLPNSRFSYNGDPGGTITKDTGEVTFSTPVANVTAIKVYIYVYSHTTEGGISGHAYIYEIEAFGQPYDDIGIRFYKGAAVYKIGVEPLLSTHKLRIRKGSTTYGIPLLATTDALASPIRIYDGSAVKSLPLVD